MDWAHADITLSTGRVVKHRRMANDAQEAVDANGDRFEMTEAEWQEYCEKLKLKVIEKGKNSP